MKIKKFSFHFYTYRYFALMAFLLFCLFYFTLFLFYHSFIAWGVILFFTVEHFLLGFYERKYVLTNYLNIHLDRRQYLKNDFLNVFFISFFNTSITFIIILLSSHKDFTDFIISFDFYLILFLIQFFINRLSNIFVDIFHQYHLTIFSIMTLAIFYIKRKTLVFSWFSGRINLVYLSLLLFTLISQTIIVNRNKKIHLRV